MYSITTLRRLLIVTSIPLLLGSSISMQRDSRSADEDKRNLLALEDRWLASEDDPEVLKDILAEDFIHALPMGFVTKDEQLSFMRKMRGGLQHGARHFEDMRARVYRDVGIVNGIVAENVGSDTRKTVFTDVFVLRNGQWQAVNAQELPLRSDATTGLDIQPKSTASSEASIEQVKSFLIDYWAGFEKDDVQHMAAAHATDYNAYFSIPSQGKGLQTYDRSTIVVGLTEAFAKFRGHHPRMALADVLVLPRSSDSAVTSYRQLFYLDGELKGDALAISEISREDGRWKIYRHFEIKRH